MRAGRANCNAANVIRAQRGAEWQAAALGKGFARGYLFRMWRKIFSTMFFLLLGFAPIQVAVHSADMSFAQMQQDVMPEMSGQSITPHDHVATDDGARDSMSDHNSHRIKCPTSSSSCCMWNCPGLTADEAVPVAELAAGIHDLPPAAVARGLSLPVNDPPPKLLSL
ncbi:hypothetical protein D3P04_18580 [Paracoccus onubensis]|uniref:DUF2946 domain-containing protein n=2 Tax=Paracoccus onubensis TaxID=1675788 RepID=A0A418SP91_9RHOB|nr:hypothetical protein D3P04_18580 [Paracoccus onubensis]